jgi:hypothetical protein
MKLLIFKGDFILLFELFTLLGLFAIFVPIHWYEN